VRTTFAPSRSAPADSAVTLEVLSKDSSRVSEKASGVRSLKEYGKGTGIVILRHSYENRKGTRNLCMKNDAGKK